LPVDPAPPGSRAACRFGWATWVPTSSKARAARTIRTRRAPCQFGGSARHRGATTAWGRCARPRPVGCWAWRHGGDQRSPGD